MGPVLLVLLLVVPIAELWVIVEVSQGIGVPAVLGLLVLVSVLGAWLLKQQGMATWRRLQGTLRQGRMPTQEVTDGALILLGGALLLTPGFISDALGLLLVLPPTRATIKGAARRVLGVWARRRFVVLSTVADRVPEAKVTRTRVRDDAPGTPRIPPPRAPEAPRRDEDDSRGRG